MKTINDLLDEPEKLLALSDVELKALLSPYFGPARAALMPPEKAEKQGVERSVMNQFLAANKEAIETLRRMQSTNTPRK
jgi:hypothetical protein